MKNTRLNRKKITGLILIGIVFVLGVVYYILTDTHILRIGGNTYKDTISFDGNLSERFFAYQGDAAFVSRSHVTFYNKEGRVLGKKVEIQASNPFASVKDRFMIVADRDGKTAYIFINGMLHHKTETEYPIITAKMGSGGNYVIVTAEQGFKAFVIVYSSDGKEMYKWHSADSYVTDADISPAGRDLAVGIVNAEGNTVRSGVALFNLGNDEPTAIKMQDNSVLINVKFISNSKITAVFDNKVTGYSRQGEEIYTVDYEGRVLHAYTLNNSSDTVLALSQSKGAATGNSVIMAYDENGKQKAEIEVPNTVKAIDAKDGILAYNLRREMQVSDISGKELAVVTPKRDIKDIVILGGGADILMVSGTNADIIKW